jgi:hypothetical protein
VLPVLDRHLETRPLGLDRTGLLATQTPGLHPRWFCSEHVRPDEPEPAVAAWAAFGLPAATRAGQPP